MSDDVRVKIKSRLSLIHIPKDWLIKLSFTHLAIEQSSTDIRLAFRRHNPAIDWQ